MLSNNTPKKSIAYFFKEIGLLLLFSVLFIFSFPLLNSVLEVRGYFTKANDRYVLHNIIFFLSYLLIGLVLNYVKTNYKVQIKIVAIFLLNLLIVPFFLLGEIKFHSVYLALVISTFVSFGVCFFIYFLSTKPTEFL